MKQFLSSNSTYARLIRTIIQGLIGVLIANIDTIFGFFGMSPEVKTIVVAAVMAILSPIMSTLGKDQEDPEE